jgi:hypothetical protein
MPELVLHRFDKLNHSDTILYEMHMLRFAAKRLIEANWRDEKDAWAYLESFLTHYRNMLEFLGMEKPSKTDVHVKTIWALDGLPTPAGIDEINEKGNALLKKYEPSDEAGGGRISQYLHHCTIRRIDFKEWPIHTMVEDIEPLMKRIEPRLKGSPEFYNVLSTPEVVFLRQHMASTAVATQTASAVVLLPGMKFEID